MLMAQSQETLRSGSFPYLDSVCPAASVATIDSLTYLFLESYTFTTVKCENFGLLPCPSDSTYLL